MTCAAASARSPGGVAGAGEALGQREPGLVARQRLVELALRAQRIADALVRQRHAVLAVGVARLAGGQPLGDGEALVIVPERAVMGADGEVEIAELESARGEGAKVGPKPDVSGFGRRERAVACGGQLEGERAGLCRCIARCPHPDPPIGSGQALPRKRGREHQTLGEGDARAVARLRLRIAALLVQEVAERREARRERALPARIVRHLTGEPRQPRAGVVRPRPCRSGVAQRRVNARERDPGGGAAQPQPRTVAADRRERREPALGLDEPDPDTRSGRPSRCAAATVAAVAAVARRGSPPAARRCGRARCAPRRRAGLDRERERDQRGGGGETDAHRALAPALGAPRDLVERQPEQRRDDLARGAFAAVAVRPQIDRPQVDRPQVDRPLVRRTPAPLLRVPEAQRRRQAFQMRDAGLARDHHRDHARGPAHGLEKADLRLEKLAARGSGRAQHDQEL